MGPPYDQASPRELKMDVPTKAWAWMFIASYIIVKMWRQPKSLPTDGGINKMCWYRYPMEYYWAIKMTKVHAATWVILKPLGKWKKPDTKATFCHQTMFIMKYCTTLYKMGVQPHKYTKTHWLAHFKSMIYMLSEWYLNKKNKTENSTSLPLYLTQVIAFYLRRDLAFLCAFLNHIGLISTYFYELCPIILNFGFPN
jgi:hypothetical protein